MYDFAWAQEFPDIYKICQLFSLSHLQNPLRYSYNSVPSIIQEGPQCGLVALAMLLRKPTKETVNRLLLEAKDCDYTYNGEIFSAKDMCELVARQLKNKQVSLYEGNLNTPNIKDFLLRGGWMLVPYDSDKDHSPCLLKGHKAHWAAVTGAVETSDDFYVLAKHGKSKYVAFWRLHDLAASNAQLHEFAPDRKMSDVPYKIPVSGISGQLGINSKAVLISDRIYDC